MQRKKITSCCIILFGMLFTGFECSSTELTSAKLYIQQKNYDKALESLKKEVAKNPKSDEGYYLLGVVYGNKEDYSNMVDAFQNSLNISKKFEKNIDDQKRFYWANLFNRGVGYYQKGNGTTNKDSSKVYYDKSANAFDTAIKLEPDSSDTYKNLAFVYLSAQDYDKAISPLEKLVDKEHSADGYRYLGEIYYNKATNLKAQYKTDGKVQDSVQYMSYYDKAINVLQDGRKYFPHNSDILLLLSNSYIGANKIDVAIDAFKDGVKEEPNNKYYRYNYGVLLLGSKDFKGAEEQFKKAVEIDPEYQNAIYNLAVTYVRWGTEMNKEADAKGEMDNTEYKTKYEQALPYLEKVTKMKGDDAQMWELLGKVYTVLGHQNEAQAAFNEADKLRK